jgi:hypothetical protein
MDTVSRICCTCKVDKSISEFYRRSDRYVCGECKSCMKLRSKRQTAQVNKDYQVPFVESEKMAIEYLNSKGIPALPGKTIRHSFVDIIAFGCIGVEVKYSKRDVDRRFGKFYFATTPSQQKNGFRAHVVMLICDYEPQRTYHIFDVKYPAFYIGGRLKTGFTFTPGAYEALKHGETRVVMVQGMMDEAQDNVQLIYDKLSEYCKALKGK